MARHVIGLTLLFLSLPSSRISFTSSHLSPLPPHPGSLFPTATIPGISPSPPRLYWPSSTMRTPPPMQHSTSIGPHGLPFGNVRKQGHSGSSSAPLAHKDDRTDKSEMELGEAWFISSSTSFQLQSPSFALQNFRYRAVSWDAIWLVAWWSGSWTVREVLAHAYSDFRCMSNFGFQLFKLLKFDT